MQATSRPAVCAVGLPLIWRFQRLVSCFTQRRHYTDADPFAEVNYRVQRAVRAEMAAEMARQEAERPRSPRPVRDFRALRAMHRAPDRLLVSRLCAPLVRAKACRKDPEQPLDCSRRRLDHCSCSRTARASLQVCLLQDSHTASPCVDGVSCVLHTPAAKTCAAALQARGAAVRAAAAVRALAETIVPRAATVSGSSRRSPASSGDRTPGGRSSASEPQDQARLAALGARSEPLEPVDQASQPADMEVDTAPQDSAGTRTQPDGPSPEASESRAMLARSPSPAAACAAVAGVKAEAGTLDTVGPADDGPAADDEPAPLLDGRLPERSWVPRRGSGAGRVDLYRVKRVL